jgi:hypothetical protein
MAGKGFKIFIETMGDILTLTPYENKLQPSLLIKEDAFCSHEYVKLDKDARILTCRKCNAFVDPFEFMLQVAYKERRLFWTKEELERKIKELSEEKERLQKEVNNLKAQKRNLNKINV